MTGPRFYVVALLGLLVVPRSLNSAPPGASAAMSEAASAFLADLNAEQRSKASFAIDADQRFEFRYTPRARTGVPLKEMTEAQRSRAHALLKTGLSLRGYTAATTIISLENVLRELESARAGATTLNRDPELYFVSIFGAPGKSPWGWKFEGHHVSVNFTLVDGAPVALAPSFFGSNPAIVRDGPKKGTRPLRDEEEAARALMAALSEPQRAKAIFDVKAPGEMLTAEKRDAAPLPAGGVTVAEMTPAQRRLLEQLLDVYLGRIAADVAKARLDALRQADFDKVMFGWAGTLDVGGPHYYRVQGPTFLIEYDNTQNDANHIHSVWRDFKGDFGRDLLSDHLREYRHEKRGPA